jgi:hypothetical protein
MKQGGVEGAFFGRQTGQHPERSRHFLSTPPKTALLGANERR